MLGYTNVVLASSETLIGWPLDPVKPDRLPITEEQPPRPESSYSLYVSSRFWSSPVYLSFWRDARIASDLAASLRLPTLPDPS